MATKQPIPIPELSPELIERFWSRVDVKGPDECWPWMAARSNKQYGYFVLKGRVMLRAHRIAYRLHYGTDALPEALHTCDFPPCCNPFHLFAGTTKDNAVDRAKKGRGHQGDKHWTRTNPEKIRRGDDSVMRQRPELVRAGERHHNARLTILQVIEIRTRFANGEQDFPAMGREYGVSDWAIRNIVNRRSWKSV